ncbi:CidA/LrgA family protein [Aggregatibacter actinomycetemcomitans]|uniref:CidA/LrgA family protein n=1 Tax=Aggregatibacter actinomycetemcomitans TaxID=714 RepID=UPI00197B334B|nr:CidA/LrgA family protein [Aggregatibacter actinomycetemcomitans]MBN6064226.1 CidA/LrgA family protein [Aggregatibacter actinomycetemcomitans]MBN6077010.1 CidA/LrgA family protein [Aggregatibacter actinomycetemcomitans]MBN6081302.1 CidA/LrgA family protein [Aggregatibacter actinomycetemcomitans]MBN6084069.1 CidA/LrgA family protein [Aggregatibacter actinomycetemcomitans]
MYRKVFDLARSLLLLYFMLYLGGLIAHFVPVGIPSSIWGLLLLFMCLITRIIKIEWVMFFSNLLIRYMALLFVPVSVGIIKYSGLLMDQMKELLLPNIISTCITLVVIGLFSDYLFSLKSFSRLKRKVIKKRAKGE